MFRRSADFRSLIHSLFEVSRALVGAWLSLSRDWLDMLQEVWQINPLARIPATIKTPLSLPTSNSDTTTKHPTTH
jgi:hypothetical protein